jgi:hypothetical protein
MEEWSEGGVEVLARSPECLYKGYWLRDIMCAVTERERVRRSHDFFRMRFLDVRPSTHSHWWNSHPQVLFKCKERMRSNDDDFLH